MNIFIKLSITTLAFAISIPSIAYAGGSSSGQKLEPTEKRRVLLLHGLFGRGDSIMGGAYFPDLPDWIRSKTGRYPLIPDMKTGNFESQYKIAIEAMNLACSDCRWHIVGHSRGGLVARMLMTRHPEKVASVTQVASPNRGCSVCDRAKDHPDMKKFLEIFGVDVSDQIIEMSQQNMDAFNKNYPIGVPNGIQFCKDRKLPSKYFHSKIYPSGKEVHAAAFVGNRFGSTGDEFTAFWSNFFDPTYYGNHILGAAGASDPKYSPTNDGVVAACSAAFGATGEEGKIFSAVDHNDTVYQLMRMSTTRGIDALKSQIDWLWKNVY